MTREPHATSSEPTSTRTRADASPILLNASRALAAGDPSTAEALFRLCVAIAPETAEAHRALGMIALNRGDHAAALVSFEEVLRLSPDDAGAHTERCGLLMELGRVPDAIMAGHLATRLDPRSAQAQFALAMALEGSGDVVGALAAYRLAHALEPTSALTCLKLASLMRSLGQLGEAEVFADLSITLDPHHYGARIVRALVLDAKGRSEDAGTDLSAAADLCPPTVEALLALAIVAIGLRQDRLAQTALERAEAVEPHQADVLSVLGTLRQSQGRTAEALAAFEGAIDLDPACVRAHYHLGGLLLQSGRLDEAVAACRKAVALAPTRDEAWLNLGTALRLQGRLPEAVAAYANILKRHGDHGEALASLGALRRQLCDWAGLEALEAASLDRSYRVGRRVSPFGLFAATGSPAEHQRCARLWASGLRRDGPPLAPYAPRGPDHDEFGSKRSKLIVIDSDKSEHDVARKPLRTFRHHAPAARSRPLRVGYLSGDLHDHATAMLVADLFEQHDRGRIETFGYSYGRDDGSAMRRRIVAALHHFTDIRGATHLDAARRIREDEIDILIDLKGYLHEARTEILTFRPAPIQVNFLGYPGTMGADFVDYIIADAIVAPPGGEAFFDEKIVRLPHCYQPNDRRRPLPDPALKRADCGLPADRVVLCCLNNSYKIRPEVFDIWMRLLARTPDAVLWLLEDNPWVADNLRGEARLRGVDPARLVFAPRVAPARHLARLGLGDLFLDTLPVNAHTTASEALWAGVPVLTVVGDAFVSRVAASLLHAVGLPELVTQSLAAYEALGLELARNSARLAELRRHLKAVRATAPLFDTKAYARHFEAALIRMGELRDAGLPPQSFSVDA